ncbi:MAG: AI-2E family transporter [Lachnospiraceae bacterium]|nr:AI-2E family transporter [Lachnospiraceae bacterium]
MKAFFDAVSTALMPIFFGAGMAFLVNPLMSFIERRLKEKNWGEKFGWVKKRTRGLALVAAIVIYTVVLYVSISLIAPNLFLSILNLIEELPGRLRGFWAKAEELIIQNESIREILDEVWKKINEWLIGFPEKEEFINTIKSTLVSLANGVYSVATLLVDVAAVAFNLVVGIIVMIYLLLSKDKFIGQSKKILYAVCKNKKVAAEILDVARAANRIFNGFISGKILDSLIIGVICFICLMIMRMPYALLISVIVGVTNVIPVFGPFIGAIPCAFLLLLVNPMYCLIFVIYIFILQQVDGNIIGPKILGDSTGLSAFWVLFSILLFGKLMGFVGMLLGVPLFATFYYTMQKILNMLLRRKALPTETEEYVEIEYIDEDNRIYYLQKEKKTESIRKQMKRKKKTDTAE